LLRVRADVPDRTVEACRRIVEAMPAWTGEPPEPAIFDRLRVALERDVPIEEEVRGPAFRFGERMSPGPTDATLIDESSAHLLERHFPYTLEVFAARAPVIGVVRDGVVVAACYAARKRPEGMEAGVDTIEPYRRRGFAAGVVTAWRDEVEAIGAQPLYSTEWDNLASRAVARKLGLVAYADTLSIG
jgi:hypothetical protein